MPPTCRHNSLHLDVSPHAAEAGFTRPPLAKRAAAVTASGRVPKAAAANTEASLLENESLFPGPLVLPGDGLALDPKEPPQSLRAWSTSSHRNPVTRQRNTLYVAPAPRVADDLQPILTTWAVPSVLPAPLKGGCSPPDPEHIRAYLEAFYHPLPVKLLPEVMSFVRWTDAGGSGKQPQYIGLQSGDGVTRVTTRPCPDRTYPRQLSLNDILDAALEVLPGDAYALVTLTNHDLYEDDDDDFCCGRAYGSSRIAVVSSARYHPVLDKPAGIDREHMWPFSHCAAHVARLCEEEEEEDAAAARPAKRPKTTTPKPVADPDNRAEPPMVRVIRAGLAAPPPSASPTGLWLSRMARTVAHELGHCFCLAHCSYYACVMQGTGGIAEDMRQPPYLCLVCLAKLTAAVGGVVGGRVDTGRLVVERYRALGRFCERWKGVGMFAAYGCWLEQRIEGLGKDLPGEEDRAERRQLRPVFHQTATT